MQPLTRRSALAALALGVGALTPLGRLSAASSRRRAHLSRPGALVVLRLAGGPSQLETFDPHPGKRIASGTRAIRTAAPGISLAAGYERLAERMKDVALVRSVVSKEGDHERGTHLFRTGFRPAPTVLHPAIGAIACASLPEDGVLVPRHVSILAGERAPRAGILGPRYDAFAIDDPRSPIPDVRAQVPKDRDEARARDLAFVDRAFAGRAPDVVRAREQTRDRARALMRSPDLEAFDVSGEPAAVRRAFGDTPFGRGCLAAARLVERGVRCVEITLPGWDSHANNHAAHRDLARVLDPALSALLDDLKRRELFDSTVVLCGGEFGRTPTLNARDGRDHWTHGFTLLLAGGAIRGGQAIGATDPEGGREVKDPQEVSDITATVLIALGLDPRAEAISPAGRPVRASDGTPISALLAKG